MAEMLAESLLWLAACAGELAPSAELPPVGAAPCIACRAPEPDLTVLYSPSDWSSLQGGGVVMSDVTSDASTGDLAGGASAAAVVKRRPAEVWAVLTDFEHWPKFMPLVRESKVESRTGNALRVEQHYRVMFVPMQHTTVYQLDASEGRIDWRLDPETRHDIESSVGHWQLVPLEHGEQTLVRYEAKVQVGRAVPGWVERWLRERSLQQTLSGVRKEVLRRFPDG
jgi:ribosome-associated toxin RatA of RatAB toxin-antitoxin module